MRTTAQLINNGKVTVPAQIRRALDVEDGDLIEIDVRPVAGGAETHD
jgi:bifunctional DNA-binding transcriptional regulator/antitoxin component of YhaV-PrlF toxin-antitoxin module